MNNFEYYNPVKVIFGEDAIMQIGRCAKELGSKALIVSYTEVHFYGDLFDVIKKGLKEYGIDCIEYFAVTANPTIEQCEKGIELCKKYLCDIVIGVGGGSAMDASKIIAAGVLYGEKDVRSMVSFSHSNTEKQVPPTIALPTIMIPTLPATGSEMNPTAVVTDEKTVKKSYLWAPDCLYPRYALVNPALSRTLPKYQTACAAIDTIAHILESYFNGDDSLNLSLQDNMQVGVIKTIYDNIPAVMAKPENTENRGVMQWASAIALNGWLLSGTYTWAPMHQMGHVLSARFNATHGATLSTMIIAWLKFFKDREDNQRYVKFAHDMFNSDIDECIRRFEDLASGLGVETRISQFGATPEMIDTLVDDVVAVSFGADNLLASTPPLDRNAIKEIYTISL